MKSRTVKPVFWKDPVVGHWNDGQRLFYIGLWMLADDTGYVQADTAAIAAELYPYRSPAVRVRETKARLDTLQGLGKVQLLPCGRHAVVPSVREHPMGGAKSDHIQREHLHRCTSNGKS